ncbi:TRAP-type transport system, large permease component, predicted N-acetylneuraminate transporter [plant metagenome]|uniref:TRAP-type transport system, large permease component, predicted N-acetylneuraminate transporter n=1 Tax=plant metagenome TaxID=1297885 RepID=A0A484R4Y5_9ZZZZ
MKRQFLAVENVVTQTTLVVACLMLALAAGLGFYQVIARFVLEQTTEWTEVLIRFSLIWMVFLGIPKAYRVGAMISVDVLRRWTPRGIGRGLDTVVALAGIALSLVFIVVGWDYARRGSVQTIAGLESISMFWAYLAVPVGGVVSLFGIVGQWLDPINRELENAQ